MTKERKAAIEQWETIREGIQFDGSFKKPLTPYLWSNNCWFCNYVRDLGTRMPDNGCRKCPLWKWAKTHSFITETDCGCSHNWYYNTLYNIVCDEKYSSYVRIKACDLIIAALKGEHIWERTRREINEE